MHGRLGPGKCVEIDVIICKWIPWQSKGSVELILMLVLQKKKKFVFFVFGSWLFPRVVVFLYYIQVVVWVCWFSFLQ